MPSLADLQRLMRDALVTGDATAVAPCVLGGQRVSGRVAIHQRHYERSVATAIVERFPATGWLIGATHLEHAAIAFVHTHPPTQPCIAEYGRLFPSFLAEWRSTAALSYVPEFADLDWHLGRLATAADRPPLRLGQLEQISPDAVADLRVTLQSGVHYLTAAWPLDELMGLYLTDSASEAWTWASGDVWLEVRGSRGALRFWRLTEGEYAFRTALAQGRSIGAAAERALVVDSQFDPGAALLALIHQDLATSLGVATMEDLP